MATKEKNKKIPAEVLNFLQWQNNLSPFLTNDELLNQMAEIPQSVEDSPASMDSIPQNQQVQNQQVKEEKKAQDVHYRPVTQSEDKNPVSLPDSMSQLKQIVNSCNKCRLSSNVTNHVFGEGNESARLMFIGEGPGEDEDRSGRPFVGKAGQLLTKIIENGLKIPRSEVYIANIVKCRPPYNRDPQADEASSCLPFLQKQIKCIKPEVIIILGKVALKNLLNIETTIKEARNANYTYSNIPAIVTYHPSALLRNKQFKRPLWEDMKKVISMLGL